MVPKIRCKVKCSETGVADAGKNADGEKVTHHRAVFYPVTGYGAANAENEKFFASTPSGKVELSMVAGQHFEAGKCYYLDFTPAPD